MAAFFISSVYSLVMMAVMIGIIIQIMDDGILSPTSLFFISVASQVVITGLLHPQEVSALLCGVVFYITIPSMYMLLQIYSIFNMNDVSWGTREVPQPDTSTQQVSTFTSNREDSLLIDGIEPRKTRPAPNRTGELKKGGLWISPSGESSVACSAPRRDESMKPFSSGCPRKWRL